MTWFDRAGAVVLRLFFPAGIAMTATFLNLWSRNELAMPPERRSEVADQLLVLSSVLLVSAFILIVVANLPSARARLPILGGRVVPPDFED